MIGIITGGRQIGGAEIICLELAEWLYKRGKDVWLYVGTGGEDQITDRARASGVRMIGVDDLRASCEESTVFLYGTKLLGQRESMASRINNAKMIYAFVGGFGMDYVTPLHLRVDSYWCEADAVRRFFVHHGIPEEMFVVCRIPTEIKPVWRNYNSFVFGVAARLIERKRIEQIIRAFMEIRRECNLIIIGDGPEKANLVNLAFGDDRISFVPAAANRAFFRDLVGNFSCFVSASEWEACSRSIREMMALGIPVIATDGFINDGTRPFGDGTRELIFHGQNGLLCPANDENALYEMMMWMLDHPIEREKLAERARNFIEADNVVSGMMVLDLLDA